jgi:hypothetical protein
LKVSQFTPSSSLYKLEGSKPAVCIEEAESMRMFRRFIAVSALALLSFGGTATAHDTFEQKVATIRDKFVAEVRACGVTPKFEPSVKIATEPAVIAYKGKSRTLVIGQWESLPPPIQGFLTEWAAHDMPGKSGKELFDTLFNGFLVGHELGHWAGDQSGRLDSIDPYEGEIEANQFAIAFAALDSDSAKSLEETVNQFSYLRTLPNPVPVGQNERDYFNAHYWTLSTEDPMAYSWYQGYFMREAWKRRDTTDFCALVKLPVAGT